ncbi:MAG: hypothetical protein QNK20_05160 [Aureibaculum sp.]|nr:hypothetical protein [Aureibaculum sp.]
MNKKDAREFIGMFAEGMKVMQNSLIQMDDQQVAFSEVIKIEVAQIEQSADTIDKFIELAGRRIQNLEDKIEKLENKEEL